MTSGLPPEPESLHCLHAFTRKQTTNTRNHFNRDVEDLVYIAEDYPHGAYTLPMQMPATPGRLRVERIVRPVMDACGITEWEILGEQRNDKWVLRVDSLDIEIDDGESPDVIAAAIRARLSAR